MRPSNDPKFGDYQANGCMAVAKATKQNPREVAAGVAGQVNLEPMAGTPEVAGPGFLNVRLHDEWLIERSDGVAQRPDAGTLSPGAGPDGRDRLLVAERGQAHARGPHSVDGDRRMPGRLLTTLGHKVIRDNHLGDWGTQFGMILWGWKNAGDVEAFEKTPVAELSRLYRLANDRIKAGDAGLRKPRGRKLRSCTRATPRIDALWERFMPHCLAALSAIYERLGVEFDEQLGESYYDPMLAGLVQELETKQIARESEGATVVFIEENKAPFLIRKRDGAFHLRDDRPGDDPPPGRDVAPGSDSVRGRPPPGRALQATVRRGQAVGV